MNYLETIEKLHPDIVHHFLQTGECKGIPEENQLFLKQMQWAAEIYEYERNISRAARLLRPSVQRRRDRMGNNMQDRIKVLGIVLKAEPIGEYDRRVVILTREKGKISAFARGARKPTSAFLAPTSPFTFGTFELYAGRNSYSVCDISADCYFEELRQDFEGAYYGMYFLELADYCTRENNDEREVLKLLYQSLRALTVKSIPRRLVRCIYEIRLIVANGEFPGLPQGNFSETALYAVEFIAGTPVEKLYTFTLKEEVLAELVQIAEKYRRDFLPGEFHTLEILETL